MTAPLDNGPMGLEESEAIAAALVELGYSARAYPKHNSFGHTVVVSGKHGTGPRFRYVLTAAAQLPKALEDLGRGETGGSDTLREGV